MLAVEHASKKNALVHVADPDFDESLNIVKKVMGRVYDRSSRLWSIPIAHLGEIKRFARDYTLLIDEQVQKNSLEYEEWKANQLKTAADFKSRVETNVDLKQALYNFQTSGVKFALDGKRAILADVVGLGKTVQAIGIGDSLLQNKKTDNVIVICGATLKRQWIGDERAGTGLVTFSNSSYMMIDGNKKQREQIYKEYLECPTDWFVMNYATLTADMSNNLFEPMLDFIVERKITLILDEVQKIKTPSAKRTKNVRRIANLSDYVYGLSATYIELGLEELYNVFRVIEPSLFGDSFMHFADRYIELDFWGAVKSYKNVRNAKNIIAPYVIRRRKEEVKDELPTRIEKNFWIKLSKEQQKIYNEIAKNIAKSIKDKRSKEKVENANILTQIGNLRQTCLSTELLDSEAHSTKLDELKRIFAEDIEHDAKVVIFCFYRKMTEIIHRELEQIGIKSVYLHGNHPKRCKDILKKREEIIQGWADSKDCNVLISTDILSEGIDALKKASILINFDILWNPAKMEQRNGRIDRLGQEADSILIIYIIAEDTVEEKMWNKLHFRKDILNDVMDDNFVSDRLTIETIRELVE